MNTSTLFTRGTIPAQLGHAQDSLTSESVENGLRALGFRKGSPGYRAIETPVTPLEGLSDLRAAFGARQSVWS